MSPATAIQHGMLAKKNRSAMIALAVIVVIALAGAFFVFSNSDKNPSAHTNTRSTPSVITSTGNTSTDGSLDPSALRDGEVFLEPVGAPTAHPFSASVANQTEAAPTASLPVVPLPTTTAPLPTGQVALAQVEGRSPGLYGGTRDKASCNKEQMITFLEADPAKAAAWAGVQGIATTEIRGFITKLTPMILTRDTRVTNHGFRNGKAFAHQSVLQAGRAVLVDEFGVPRAQCSCGNPLAPPKPTSQAPVYVGPQWPGFAQTTIVVVVAGPTISTEFVIIDLDNGGLLRRPVGFTEGAVDTAVTPAESCSLFPNDASCQVTEILNIGNIYGVAMGPTNAATFTVTTPTLITSIFTYHYGSGTPAGQVGLQASDGTMYGPYQTTGTDGQGGVPNANWTAEPNVVIPAGTYTVWDSEPSTWSTNEQSGFVGFTVVKGVLGVSVTAHS